MTGTVLVLGASGKIGSHAARAFRSAGWQVRTHDRAKGDMTEDARGADVIVNGLNPPNYHNWARLIPEITERVITAARASGAMVIVPGNVYNFGAAPGTWSEHTPHRATTRKGHIRIEMERAYRDSGVQTLILRAGNFIDPEREDDVMGLFLMRNIRRGRLIYPGNPDTVQTYCYLPARLGRGGGEAGRNEPATGHLRRRALPRPCLHRQ
jgi:nucleoside-diphosphate-sugar epimerase